MNEVSSLLGVSPDQVFAGLRFSVVAGKGAFTETGSLLPGFDSVRMELPSIPRNGIEPFRGVSEEGPTEANGGLHEVTLCASEWTGVDCLFSDEGGGHVTISLEYPWQVCLITEGQHRLIPTRQGEDRYYAEVDNLPPGDYVLAILKGEEQRQRSAA